jgi:hypothetical protein
MQGKTLLSKIWSPFPLPLSTSPSQHFNRSRENEDRMTHIMTQIKALWPCDQYLTLRLKQKLCKSIMADSGVWCASITWWKNWQPSLSNHRPQIMIFEQSVHKDDAMVHLTLRVPDITAIYSIFRNLCCTVLVDWKSACETIHAVEGSKTRHIDSHREISELRIVSLIRTGTLIKVVVVLSKLVHKQDCWATPVHHGSTPFQYIQATTVNNWRHSYRVASLYLRLFRTAFSPSPH